MRNFVEKMNIIYNINIIFGNLLDGIPWMKVEVSLIDMS